MNPTILTALIGAAGLVIGSFLGFLGNLLSTRQRIKELKIKHEQELDTQTRYFENEFAKLEQTSNQKLDENILANARQYKETVYIPLFDYLSTLEQAFKRYESGVKENEFAKEEFRSACNEFLQQVSDLKEIFIISELAEELSSFKEFIRESMYYEPREEGYEPREEENVRELDDPIIGAGIPGKQLSRNRQQKREVEKKPPAWWERMPLRRAPIYSRRAPIYSRGFEIRFSKDIMQLEHLTKKVVIGAR